ncbi:bifunctional glycosyltransferase family 2 protein/CDP-glycerol:glycerophosphate glycerophosphotransferase [Streptomyces caniscabiei]|uniref:Bifunctional glycosyltransferase family 2 protein/CDP-glycerol:glycerophosphate glycerophosphotransferase n=1 Tax=Streptomyces caniscabiei TaxID=2746961 RepID=A0A927QIV2_9ACTN|nr:bifunctional glycosyltransferase family 2 protein/CDP-glycerol:glycerophosphate glycerophosphotransferase [Streptomyces caniscabiei]MBD9728833.1 bifunctional glycosyltransferase family 2 protein/CDP-glycerol:glycerophosphate glycerophosphotransferase [Streptomyces caniscabiei]MDX3514022.1 bifunctional glycosyltransferase family 2 protein/CDP-glycerol:glycerophosphate glycerophosphotransferase [Streptomyces caniscabiei]MDX3723382.1 bifunctional glycosyltransferase family 2 protein/CDP-glycerol
MPRFSVVVPVFEVRGQLRECLDSVLEQSYGDVELIAVDDCSPDGGGEILDAYAARDGRVRVLHLPANVGPGRARNAGLPYATGDFVLFLDGDDTLVPGALRALADRLDEAGDPDVLVFDHVRAYWWGETRRDAGGRLLSAVGAGTFTLAERPEILDLPTVVWNKAYRREYLEAHGFRFPPGHYEDTAWAFPVLLGADRIATLDRICVSCRQRPRGTLLSTTGRGHFDVLDQWERIFAHLNTRPDLAGWRPRVRRAMAGHCLDVLAAPDRVPLGDRAEFFRRAAGLYRKHRSGDASPAPAHPVLEGGWAAYRARRWAVRARTALGARGERLRAAGAEWVGRGWSLAHERLPLDPNLALYSAFSHGGVLGDPAAVYQAAREFAPHIRGVWVVRPERVAALPPGVEHVTPGSPEYLRLAARATYFVGNADWPGALTKRPGSVHVHTHQGTPLKFMGADLLHKPGARLGVDVPGMLRRADRWDHSLVANRHSELVWSRAYPCGFTSLRTGSPRNDVLVNAGPGGGAAVRERLGVPAGHTVVLYAPTPRDHRRGGHVERFDLARFAADLRRSLGEALTLVVRLHPSLADGPARGYGLAELHRRGVVVDATDEPHVEELMLASDVLVTDYSALMVDYANLDRPIVVHADDVDTFAASRGLYVDLVADAPGHVSRSYRELAWLFDSGQWRDRESARLRAGFRERYCEFDDGRASERVVRTLMLGEPAGAVPAPRPAASRAAAAAFPSSS